MADFDTGDWLLNGDLGYWLWEEIMERQNLHLPRTTDAYLELELDTFDGLKSLQKTRGVKSTDGNWSTLDAKDWFDKSQLGYTRFTWDFRYDQDNIFSVGFNGQIPTTLGTMLWFQIHEEDEGGPVEVTRVRIPVPDSLTDEVIDWAEGAGGENIDRHGILWDDEYAVSMQERPRDYWEINVTFPEVDTERDIKNILLAAMDWAEQGVETHEMQRFGR